jgi:hypothetical protein
MTKFRTVTNDGQEAEHSNEGAAYEAVQDRAAASDFTGMTTVFVWLPIFSAWQLFERVNHTDLRPNEK